MATRKQPDPVPTEAAAQTNGPAPSCPAPTPAPSAAIVNNRVSGTRITVWDTVYYLESGTGHEEIAQILGLFMEQVRAAVQYIRDNKAEVMAVHRKIEERNARGNPPEVQAKLDAAHARFTEYVRKIREAQGKEATRGGNSGRQ